MSDQQPKGPPPEVRAALESMFEAMMNKVKEISTQVQLFDCDACGEENCVSKDPDHVYENPKLGLTMAAPALVCSSCGVAGFETSVYKGILEAEEAIQGRPYVRYEVKDGQLHKHSLH